MIASRLIVFPMAFFLLSGSANSTSQTPQGQPLGQLSSAGEVYLGNAKTTGESTIFVGETLHTGPNGAARVTVSGRGSLILAAQSRLSFEPAPRYFAELQQGSVVWRALAGAENFQLRFRNFTVVPFGKNEAAAEVDLAPDGSAEVSCTDGSIALIEIAGPQSIFLNSEEVVTISAEGSLRRGGPGSNTSSAKETAGTPSSPGGTAPAGRNSQNRKVLWIGLAGGGAAAAVAALAASHKSSGLPESPSHP